MSGGKKAQQRDHAARSLVTTMVNLCFVNAAMNGIGRMNATQLLIEDLIVFMGSADKVATAEILEQMAAAVRAGGSQNASAECLNSIIDHWTVLGAIEDARHQDTLQ
ncbi:hypothetical protein [Oceaniglobus trochenteri]|uniref:hypothetical protein n=1 Tax=Oceaniglobus trochenteri TaxID=2763260 RepID=UPI001CFFF958|nr:hypothetical protein [Oceaniglobus trochenteri]